MADVEAITPETLPSMVQERRATASPSPARNPHERAEYQRTGKLPQQAEKAETPDKTESAESPDDALLADLADRGEVFDDARRERRYDAALLLWVTTELWNIALR